MADPARTRRPIASLLFAFSAVLAIGTAGPAAGQAQLAIAATICDEVDAQQEAADQRIVEDADNAFGQGGYRAIGNHYAALNEVIRHAPSCYPQIEQRGDETIVRTDDPSEFLILSSIIGASRPEADRQSITMQRNIYPQASFLLGALAVEMERYEEAIVSLDRGLALQPHHPMLTLEKATALMTLHQPADAYALLQATLNDPIIGLVVDRSRFMRQSGVALIDLNRLDDAEAALNESIRLQPNNPNARRELDYIGQLRAGGPQRDLAIVPPSSSEPPPPPNL